MNLPGPGAPGAPEGAACPICGAAGTQLYDALSDRLFQAPGTWRIARCSGATCGLLYLDPPPSAQELKRAYAHYHTHSLPPRRAAWQRRARQWVKDGYFASRFGYRVPGAPVKRALALVLAPRARLRERLDRLVMYLPPQERGRVLDVGCGSGETLEQLRQLGWSVEGVDTDPAAVAVAASRGIEVRHGTLERQAYPDRSFDAITMSHVLEHVPDPVGLLDECRRLLAAAGRLVLVTPNAASMGHHRFGAHWRGLEPPRHLNVFTPGALGLALGRARLRVEMLRSSWVGAAFFDAESRRIGGDAGASESDAAARSFERDERRALEKDPWAGEELVVVAEPE